MHKKTIKKKKKVELEFFQLSADVLAIFICDIFKASENAKMLPQLLKQTKKVISDFLVTFCVNTLHSTHSHTHTFLSFCFFSRQKLREQ